VRLWKTLITPFFWPTKMRPSPANCTWTGLVSPLKATVSRNPGGNVDAPAAPGAVRVTTPAASIIRNAVTILRQCRRAL
jgi:hypothetical protein